MWTWQRLHLSCLDTPSNKQKASGVARDWVILSWQPKRAWLICPKKMPGFFPAAATQAQSAKVGWRSYTVRQAGSLSLILCWLWPCKASTEEKADFVLCWSLCLPGLLLFLGLRKEHPAIKSVPHLEFLYVPLYLIVNCTCGGVPQSGQCNQLGTVLSKDCISFL